VADELFLILAQATAGPATRYVEGARHAVLVFARAGSHDEALAVGTEGLAELGWSDPAFQKVGIIELGPHLKDEDRAPAEHAMANGCAVRVYAEPVARR
jgi:hypothetical protein